MTDDDFLRAFEECRLPRPLWTHEAHVRMAWLYLRRNPLEEVIPVVTQGIRRYNTSLGNASGYHETITIGYLTLIDHRLRGEPRDEPFAEFSRCYPDLLDRSLSALLSYYSRDRLFSAEAIERFVEPDLAPLPRRTNQLPGG